MKIYDITPIIKTDTFVNDDYRSGVLTNIGAYVEPNNKWALIERVKERLAMTCG